VNSVYLLKILPPSLTQDPFLSNIETDSDWLGQKGSVFEGLLTKSGKAKVGMVRGRVAWGCHPQTLSLCHPQTQVPEEKLLGTRRETPWVRLPLANRGQTLMWESTQDDDNGFVRQGVRDSPEGGMSGTPIHRYPCNPFSDFISFKLQSVHWRLLVYSCICHSVIS
jgi:hypothetical protein